MPKEVSRLIRELERQMKAAADELEFEKAALLRDQIFELRAVLAEKEEAEMPAWERERRGRGWRSTERAEPRVSPWPVRAQARALDIERMFCYTGAQSGVMSCATGPGGG